MSDKSEHDKPKPPGPGANGPDPGGAEGATWSDIGIRMRALLPEKASREPGRWFSRKSEAETVAVPKTSTRKSLPTWVKNCVAVAGEAFNIALGIAMIWFCIVTYFVSKKTINISLLSPHIKHHLAQSFTGSDTDIGDMQLMWNDTNRTVMFAAQDIRVKGQQGAEVARIQSLRTELSLGSIIAGDPKPTSLDIRGGAISLERDADGTLAAYLGSNGADGGLDPIVSINSGDSNSGTAAALGELRAVNVDEASVYLRDYKAMLSVVLTGGQASLVRSGDAGFRATASGEVSNGQDAPSQMSMRVYTTEQDDLPLAAEVTVKDFVPARYAADTVKLSRLRDFAAPITGSATVEFNPERRVSALDVDITLTEGKFAGQAVQSAAAQMTYRPLLQTLDITQLEWEGPGRDFTVSGQVRSKTEDFSLKSPLALDLRFGRSVLDFGGAFPAPVTFESAAVAGDVDLPNLRFVLDTFNITRVSQEIAAAGTIQMNPDMTLKDGQLDVTINGRMDREELLTLWPESLSRGARAWVVKSFKSGEVRDVSAKLNISEESTAAKLLNNADFDMRYTVRDAVVEYLPGMSPLRVTLGKAHVRGNAMTFTLGQDGAASIDDVSIGSLTLDIPQFKPRGELITITASGEGDVSAMLKLGNQDPLNVLEGSTIALDAVKGQGTFDLTLKRPFGPGVPPEALTYTFSGDMSDVSAPIGVGGNFLNSGQLRVTASRSGGSLGGTAKLGDLPGTLQITQPPKVSGLPRLYSFSGQVDRDDLVNTDLGLRKYFGGSLGYKLTAAGDMRDFAAADIELDLAPAELTLGPYWNKPVGVPGSAKGVVSYGKAEGFTIKNLQVDAPGLTLNGSTQLAPNFRLLDLNLGALKIDGVVDAAVKVAPNAEGIVTAKISGTYLDISPWVSRAFSTQSASGYGVPIRLTVDLDKLILDDQYVLSGASASLFHDGDVMQQARLKGSTPAGEAFAEITVAEETGLRNIDVRIPDAAKASIAFIGLDNISGGTLDIIGTMPAAGEDGAMQAVATLSDFKLVKAPALAQILSLASLQGLVDVLGGEGMTFKSFEVPFTLENGLLRVRKARANGSAIGLTGNGDIRLDSQEVDFDGVIVPAYSLGSLLEDMPLVGNIVTGKTGEGLLALNYTVGGTLEELSVKINPLSALTPGFLRGIFQPERSPLPDMQRDMTSKADE